MKHVTIIQRRLTHYRVALFEKLRTRLAQDEIRLALLHGEARPVELSKNDCGSIPWAVPLPTRYFLNSKLCWQPFANKVADDDLVIIPQENTMLANHLALLKRPAKRIAFWGHGGNFQVNRAPLRESFRSWTTRGADWYFAYTRLSVDLIAKAGFPTERITQLDNAVDLHEISNDLQRVVSENPLGLREHFDLGPGKVGLYLGSLYTHKRLDFLLQSAHQIRKKVPNFQLVVVGAGPDQPYIEEASADHEWIHYLGSLRGIEKARALYVADVMLNPGLVGLGVLDSFISETPMLTTDCGLHSPEIAYLNTGNGVMTENNMAAYVEACAALLNDDERLALLKVGCRRAAVRYSLENMVKNFATGIEGALRTTPR